MMQIKFTAGKREKITEVIGGGKKRAKTPQPTHVSSAQC